MPGRFAPDMRASPFFSFASHLFLKSTKIHTETSMRTCKALCALTLGSAIMTLGIGTSHARDLTIVNFGGANGDAQTAAFIKPLEKERSEEHTSEPQSLMR